MRGRRNPFVAREGIPFLVLIGIGAVLAFRFLDILFGIVAVALFLVLFFVFRDPRRGVPASPLGVVSPVDGRVEDVRLTDKHVLQGEAHVVRIRIDNLGTYTARAPIEGKIMDLRSVAGNKVADYRTSALWIQTDEGDDVVLQFQGFRFGLAPHSFMRFGERVGQGQRCAYLRLTRFAEIHLPIESRVLVKPGQLLTAGTDLIAKVPHP